MVVRRNGVEVEHHARREVVLSLGSVATPLLLQRSGIGPADVLRAAGVDVVVDSPRVGAGIREHRCVAFHFRLNQNVGYNKMLSTVPRQALTTLKYLATKKGPMATPAYDIVGFGKSRPDAERPDFQLLATPLSLATANLKEPTLEREPGMQCIGYVLRPESEGTITITSADPGRRSRHRAQLLRHALRPRGGRALCRAIRRLFSTDPIASYIDHETQPGAGGGRRRRRGDDRGAAHVGVLRVPLGRDRRDGHRATAALDPELRVRGVDGLRVVDTSVVPTMVSGNCNAPMMAFGWRAADLILDAPEARTLRQPGAPPMSSWFDGTTCQRSVSKRRASMRHSPSRTRPGVEVAPTDLVHVLGVLDPAGRGDVGGARGAVAVELDHDVGDLVRGAVERGLVATLAELDEVVTRALEHVDVVRGAVGVPDRLAEARGRSGPSRSSSGAAPR